MMFECIKCGQNDRFKLGKGDQVSNHRCKQCNAELKIISAERYRILKEEEVYLDWWNNFLSIEKFAEHYGMSEERARAFINRVRDTREKRLEKEA